MKNPVSDTTMRLYHRKRKMFSDGYVQDTLRGGDFYAESNTDEEVHDQNCAYIKDIMRGDEWGDASDSELVESLVKEHERRGSIFNWYGLANLRLEQSTNTEWIGNYEKSTENGFRIVRNR